MRALIIRNVFFAMLFIGLAIPLLIGKVRMNRWYGFRLKEAFRSDEHWRKINRYGARQLLLWATLPIIAAVLPSLFALDLDDTQAALFTAIPLVIIALAVNVLTFRYARGLGEGGTYPVRQKDG
jgi:hypothetical protein